MHLSVYDLFVVINYKLLICGYGFNKSASITNHFTLKFIMVYFILLGKKMCYHNVLQLCIMQDMMNIS